MCETMLPPASRAARPGVEPNPKSANEDVDAEVAEEPMPAVPKSLRHADVGRPVVKRGNMAEERGGGSRRARDAPATHARENRAKQAQTAAKTPPPAFGRTQPHPAERILRSASCAYARYPECARVPSQHPAGCAPRRAPSASCIRPELIGSIANAGADASRLNQEAST